MRSWWRSRAARAGTGGGTRREGGGAHRLRRRRGRHPREPKRRGARGAPARRRLRDHGPRHRPRRPGRHRGRAAAPGRHRRSRPHARQPQGLRRALRRDRSRPRPRAAAPARPAHIALIATAVYARRFVSLVKLEHTVFALPYAYTGAILALGEVPSASQIFWITVAMVGARSLAMALNRLIDAAIDARNPRTARREIPAGLLSRSNVIAFAIASLIVFLVAVWQLAPITRWLWPIPVAGFVIYPYLKRFTWLCHPFLGVVDGLAPVGGWVAVTNHVDPTSFLLGGAVALWIGGFDIIYATMDLDIDRAQGLHSIPRRFGIATALRITRVFHLLSVILLVWLGIALGLGPLYYLGVAVVAALLAYENSIVSADDLSRVDMAFLTMNGVIALVFLAGVLADAVA